MFLLSVIILKTKLFQSKTVSKPFILGVFYLKVVLAILYGYLSAKNNWGDTHHFFSQSKLIGNLWPEHPFKFFRMVFGPTFRPLPEDYAEIIGTNRIYYYGELRGDLVIRINALLQTISSG